MLYFHGHSVGGTNPSLLEAMACNCNIVAHDNIFNREVLQENGKYFTGVADLTTIINTGFKNGQPQMQLERLKEHYNWPLVISQYEKLMIQALRDKETAGS